MNQLDNAIRAIQGRNLELFAQLTVHGSYEVTILHPVSREVVGHGSAVTLERAIVLAGNAL